ncbi:MAG: hypothetical protein ABIT07_03385, partial [Ferruginibacter sp.]
MLKKNTFLLFLLFSASLVKSQAVISEQPSTNNFKTYEVAIFASLYLDSVFADGEYKYDKNFPKYAVQALDFVQGAQIALDSMKVYKSNIHATIYDSKSLTQPVNFLLSSKNLDSLDLIIGSVKDEDYQVLAAFAQQKN